MNDIEKRQLIFKNSADSEQYSEETAFSSVLLAWAKRQPHSEMGFIDVAAGRGIEAATLTANGFPCIAQDPSEEMTQASKNSIVKLGSAEKLNFPDSSFSGILIKDAWLFLPPHVRRSFFAEAMRTLVSTGSVLLQSERADVCRARYVPNDSEISQTLSSFDFSTYEDWLQELARLQKQENVYSVEYECLPESVEKLAHQAGFLTTKMTEYDRNSLLSTQSRWVKKAGFILELKKI